MLEMSQTKLAEKLDLTFQQIQKYEKGANRIGSSRLYQIAQILEVDPNYFFDGLDPTGDSTDPVLSAKAVRRAILMDEEKDPRILKAIDNLLEPSTDEE